MKNKDLELCYLIHRIFDLGIEFWQFHQLFFPQGLHKFYWQSFSYCFCLESLHDQKVFGLRALGLLSSSLPVKHKL